VIAHPLLVCGNDAQLGDIIEAKIANAPTIQSATIAQGKRNKDKWAWAICMDKYDPALIEWYANTVLSIYTFIEG
jgi:hypothetical protein